MYWTPEQQNRLQKEIDILSTYFPSFQFVTNNGVLCLDGHMYTNSKNLYYIRLYVPSDIPYSVPTVVITYPSPVYDYWGKSLAAIGASSEMHLLSPFNGYPKICTYKESNWNANVTFYKVLIKVRLWLEALDGHKATGNKLDYYLKHQN